jgi:hypothetical protein
MTVRNEPAIMYPWILIVLGMCIVSCAHVGPGERLVLAKEVVHSQYDCARKKLPFVVIEQNEIRPQQLHPGEEFHHHFVYVMCPSQTLETVQGRLERRVYFKGNRVFDDSGNFAFRPGKWDVDAFIKVPPEAAPGTYRFELFFGSKVVTIKKSLDFAVQR